MFNQPEENKDTEEIITPEATIYLTPKSNPISASANVMLVDAVQNASYLKKQPNNVIASYPVEITVKKKMVIKDDVEAAKIELEKELRNSAEAQLKDQVLKMNREAGIELTLLTGENAIKFGDPKVSVDQSEVSGTIPAKGIAFNYNELVNILETRLKLAKSPEKKLISVDTESITYRVIPIEAGADTTRQIISATINGIEQYEINPAKENGRRLIENIRSNVLGKSLVEAKNHIQQLPSIDKVTISNLPESSSTLPLIPGSIIIEIVEEM